MPPPPPKIVIFTTRGGQGLLSGARAIQQALAAVPEGGGTEPEVIDFFEAFSPLGARLTAVYNFLLRRSLRWSSIYIRALHGLRPDRWPFLYRGPLAALRDFLARARPDLIVVTSQYVVAIVAFALREARPRPVAIVANVDPGPSCVPVWFDDGMSMHILPTPEAMAAYVRLGFDPARAVQSRLVVRQEFLAAAALERAPLRERLGWRAEDFVVLFAGSREGYGGVLPLVRRLGREEGLRPVVVCGTNEALRRAALRLGVEALGWRDDMPALMRAADVVVAKPGKQTMKETLAVRTPLVAIAFPSVMEQEQGNLELMERRGTLLAARSAEEIAGLVARLRTDAGFRGEVLRRIEEFRAEIDPGAVARAILAAYERVSGAARADPCSSS